VELVDGCLEGVVGDEGLVAQLAVGLGTGAGPVVIRMYECMYVYMYGMYAIAEVQHSMSLCDDYD